MNKSGQILQVVERWSAASSKRHLYAVNMSNREMLTGCALHFLQIINLLEWKLVKITNIMYDETFYNKYPTTFFTFIKTLVLNNLNKTKNINFLSQCMWSFTNKYLQCCVKWQFNQNLPHMSLHRWPHRSENVICTFISLILYMQKF